MIKGYCHTNLDDWSCEVIVFFAVPRYGERVQATYKGNAARLYVCGVTHCQQRIGGEWIPYIEVELTELKQIKQ